MKYIVLAAALLLTATQGASAHEFEAGPIKIEYLWIRSAPASAPVLGGYMTLTNDGPGSDRLVGASTPAAQRVEIHESTVMDGVAKMRRLDGVSVAPGQTVSLGPGGIHLMLFSPTNPLSAGQTVPAILEFEKAGKINVQFTVQKSPTENQRKD